MNCKGLSRDDVKFIDRSLVRKNTYIIYKMILYAFLSAIVLTATAEDTCEAEEGNWRDDDISAIKTELLQHIQKQEAAIAELQKELIRQEEAMKTENNRLKEELATMYNTLYYGQEYDEYSIYGCHSENITMLCNNGGVINITQAFYGQYALPNRNCPQPNLSEDCFELISETDPSEWMSLKLSCDNKSLCTYKNPGGEVYACFEPSDADFVLIYYSCIFDIPLGAIGFTMYATENQLYSAGDRIVFDGTVSNVDNNYDVTTHEFICPYDATHQFSLSLLSAQDTATDIYANIIHKSQPLGAVYDDEHNKHLVILGTVYANDKSQGSVTVIANCKRGERVWAEMVTSGTVRGDDVIKGSIFSGFPLV